MPTYKPKARGAHKGTKPARSPSPSPSRSASASSSGGASASATDTSDADAEDAADYRRGGYHPVRIGERFKNGRYAVLRKLGWGHFSTVWLVSDAEAPPGDAHAGLGALKVVKSAAHYAEAARDEVQILARVAARDPGDGRHCCRLRDSFEHAGPHGRHVCMVFEVLGDNLLALIRAYAHRGVPLPAVRRLARQVLVALDFLHRECGVIHTDLKPENVMLREPLRPPPAGGGGGLEGAAAASGGGGGPVLGGGAPGKLAAVAEAGGRLSKAQRNRLKKRAAAKAAGGKGGEGSGGAGGDEEMGEGSSRGASPSAPPPAPAGGPLAASVSLDAMSLEEGAAAAAADAALAAAAPAPAPAPAGRRPPLDLEALGARLGALDARVVDFGNACWADKHFTDDIQTRQYRAPEVILGASYDASADVWSLACLVFELATGDFLFEPRAGRDYSRDEDHLAQVCELLGRPPRAAALAGRRAREFFTREGRLRRIGRLNYWPLEAVLREKYRLPEDEARGLADFLTPMLAFAPGRRASAAQALDHPWLRGELPPPRPAAPAAAPANGAAGDAAGDAAGANGARAPHGGRSRSRTRSRSPRRSPSPSPRH